MKTRLSYLALCLLLASCFARAQDEPAPSTPPSRAILQPDISVVGNAVGLLSNQQDPHRDHLELREIELVIGSPIYPGVRGDAVIALHDPEFTAELEEGYLTVDQFMQAVPIGGRLGIVRLPFGKTNPLHPHQLPTVDTPTVVNNLLGDEFIGNGFEFIGLAPTRGGAFLQGQVGRWRPRAAHAHDEVHDHRHTMTRDIHDHDDHDDHHHGASGAGFAEDRRLTMGRLWAGTALGRDGELELGVSGAFGRGQHEEEDELGNHIIEHTDIRLLGADITWRRWLPRERRIMLQAEAIHREEKSDEGTERQFGYFLLGTFRPGALYEIGTRYDWSATPAEASVHESYISAFATRSLNETTLVRLQYKHGTNPERDRLNQVMLQVIFGFGPHAHVLQ